MKIILIIVGMFYRYGSWKERIELYKQALELMENSHWGFCSAFDEFSPRKDKWIGKLWLLPEIYWYKPFWRSSKKYWWSIGSRGMERRREILRKAISEYNESKRLESEWEPGYYINKDRP